MTTETSDVLVLGGTGKTGTRLATLLRDRGATVRTAARSGADVAFDWSKPDDRDRVLEGVDRVYVVPPALRLDFAADVIDFLDRAGAAGVTHVALLSARGVEDAPPEAAMRAVELDLLGRSAFTSTILRPSFFAQNFTSGSFAEQIATGVLALPAGDGAEAFIDVDDIAAVAATALLDPAAHAGAQYELTGPEALTHREVVALITAQTGKEVRYQHVPVEAWIEVASAGLPREYAAFLASLLDVIAQGHGATPTDTVQRVTGRPATRLANVFGREYTPIALPVGR
jgi:uncharacterized protein YbjT (DUF2867 family)